MDGNAIISGMICVDNQFCTYDLIKENDLNDQSINPKKS